MKIVLTPNIFLKSGSLNLKGMFDTWSLLGVLSPCLLACTETTADWESAWLTAQDWDCCWAAAIAAAAAAAREVATSWEPSSPCKLKRFYCQYPLMNCPAVSFSSCQRNLIKTFQIEGMIALIRKIGFEFFMRLVKWPKIAIKKCQNLILKLNFHHQKIIRIILKFFFHWIISI